MFASSRALRFSSRRPILVCREPVLRSRCRSQWRLSSSISSNPEPNSSSVSTSSTSLSSSQPTSPHNSLSSFLSYAQTASLSPTSTVYIGTRYEYVAQEALSALGFSLTRSGGRSDGGIDLYGTWTLPGAETGTATGTSTLRCLVQCKSLTKKVGPNLVRELEGMFAAARHGWQGDDVVGVLCATREASKGVREAVRRSKRGIVWIMLQENAEDETESAPERGTGVGKIRQVLWNERVADLGATGVSVGLVYDQPDAAGEVQREVRLMWKGQVWEADITTNIANSA